MNELTWTERPPDVNGFFWALPPGKQEIIIKSQRIGDEMFIKIGSKLLQNTHRHFANFQFSNNPISKPKNH